MGIRDFTDEEVNELSNYILQSIEYSELGRSNIYLYNYENIKNVRVFLLSFKILNTAANFSSNLSTRKKLKLILNEVEEVYYEVSRLYNLYKNSAYSSDYAKSKVLDIMNRYEIKINNIIELINILSRKQSLVNLNKVTGIRRDTAEGKNVYDKFRKEVEEVI